MSATSKTYLISTGEADGFKAITFHLGQRIRMKGTSAAGEITKLGKFIYAYMDYSDKTVRLAAHQIEAIP